MCAEIRQDAHTFSNNRMPKDWRYTAQASIPQRKYNMSNHSFNPILAKKYGIYEAIIISSFIYWTQTNAAKESNFHNDRYWCYGTPEYFTKFFIYLTPFQIRYSLKKLTDCGALLKGNFNKKGYDKTNWYSLSDAMLIELNLDRTCLKPATTLIEQICSIDRTNFTDASNKFVQPIPVTKPVTKQKDLRDIPDSTNTGISKIKNYAKDERFMRFYNAYPKKVDPRDAWKAFKSIVGNEDELLEQILQDLELRKSKHSQWQDMQFIKYPAVYLRKGEYLGDIFNANEVNEEKEKAKKEENAKRMAKQEELSRQALERERKEQEQIHRDGKAFREMGNNLRQKGTVPDGLKNLRQSMGFT